MDADYPPRWVIIPCRFTRIPEGSKKQFKKALQILVTEGILAQEESEELKSLIDYRNDIAHRIHTLTGDITHPDRSQTYLRKLQKKYRYDALGKFEHYKEKIQKGLCPKFIMSLSMDSMYFYMAEKTYKEELDKLRKKIDNQLSLRKQQLSDVCHYK